MKKNVIHLNESQLRNLIKESVKRVLRENSMNELDWKTYANAERKARRLGRGAQYRKFKQGKIDAFNKKYGVEGGLTDGESYSMKTVNSDFLNGNHGDHPVLNFKGGKAYTLYNPKDKDNARYEIHYDNGQLVGRNRYFDERDDFDDVHVGVTADNGDLDYIEYLNGNSKYSDGRWRHYFKGINGEEEDFDWGRN